MRQYTTISQVKNYTLLNWESSWDTQVESWIEQMTKFIENYTQRVFEGVSEERVFDGAGGVNLMVDDLLEVYTLQIDDVEIDSADYKLYPANTTPYYKVYYGGGFSMGKQNIVVDGVWGYSLETPLDIEYACTVLVAGIIQNQKRLSGEKKSETIGNYRVDYSDKQIKDFEMAKYTLDFYKKSII